MRRVQSNTLDVGIDVHLKNWSTAILSKHSVLRRFLQVDCEGPTLISYIVAKHLAMLLVAQSHTTVRAVRHTAVPILDTIRDNYPSA